MKLTLFTYLKIFDFFLPTQVSGSYSFGRLDNDEDIVTVEAVNNQWVIKSREGMNLIVNNTYQNEVIVAPNEFYIIQIEDHVSYLMTSPIYGGESRVYTYEPNKLNLVIGNSKKSNFVFNNQFFNGDVAIIKGENNTLKLTVSPEGLVYVNSERVIKQESYLAYGDILNVYNLKIMFLPKMLLVNNPPQGIIINNLDCRIEDYVIEQQKNENIEVKEVDLYPKDTYFSKSPRIRRTIEEKKLKIDQPPAPPKKDELPAILTVGPMISTGAMSGMTLLNQLMQVSNGQTTFEKAWPSLLGGVLMLTTSLVWPNLTKVFNKRLEKSKRRDTEKLYKKYLQEKDTELRNEIVTQKSILEENLITANDCLNIISARKNNFWSKRVDQNDFLVARIGKSNVPLKMEVQWPEAGFSIEQDDLKKLAEQVIDSNRYIENSPQEYSFYENFLTAIMGIEKKCYGLMNNILVQFLTFYCYDELKIIVFTNKYKSQNWESIKYSNYCFNTDRSIRFYAENIEEARELSSYLMQELSYKLQISESGEQPLENQKPYYLIICDDYTTYKKIDFFKNLLELDNNIGYSTIILEKKLDHLPSKCKNFINLNEGSSGILKNSYEQAEITDFHDEINYNINMMEIVKMLSNIPVEVEIAGGKLPEAIEFLQMEKVGKVEQLNILNRWNQNDSTKSLKAEIGVDEEENLMYLDLHEKAHGPHGLIAGTTGSGKSEFIITYILSLAMNYSPDDVSFILIDYKGGGLAYAFENKLTGMKLPHLAGTITNLDKSEMNRTLVSIDSELKRRQAEFNKARDMLGESTIDIYKYQRYYHEGKLKEPITHLFIISDEFAELKSQQPDFMENLISVARIGRSLGVHLILATQKPTGVVNDQIWSNTKFRVCLKVADASDSNEIIKKPDAALLKQSGRFYLQVGMDEYFALGQSGWCGAKYYPSDKVVQKIDKSVDFIDNMGQIIKRIQENGSQVQQQEAQGEQLGAILKEIINVSQQVNKTAKKLWLDNIPDVIILNEIQSKYNITPTQFNVTAIIGEYDAPEKQEQGIVTYTPIEDGNLLIAGSDGGEKEQLLSALIYTMCKNHTVDELNFYIIDYGSEQLRLFNGLPHCGGMVFDGEDEKYTNLLKLIREETVQRKKLFTDYGGEYKNYIKNSNEKLPIMIVIVNNYDTIKENIKTAYDDFPELLRDSARYGIIYIITANSPNSGGSKVNQNITSFLGLKLKDVYEYTDLLGIKVKNPPKETVGRGMLNNDGAHEFQTGVIVENISELSKFVIEFINLVKEKNTNKAKKIPVLPNHIRVDDVLSYATGLNSVPLGMNKATLDIVTADFSIGVGKLFSSNKLSNTELYARSILNQFKYMKVATILIDGTGALTSEKPNASNYFASEFDKSLENITSFIQNREEDSATPVAIIIYGLEKFLKKLEDKSKFEEFIDCLVRNEKIPVLVFEEEKKLKNYNFDSWYTKLFESVEGVWIGSGASEQSVLRINSYDREFSLEYPNDIGSYVSEGTGKIIKLLDFYSQDGDE